MANSQKAFLLCSKFLAFVIKYKLKVKFLLMQLSHQFSTFGC